MNTGELKRWPFPEQEFLGRGSFGNVKRGLYCGTPVAVKELLTGRDQLPEVRRRARAELLEEIGILKGLSHPNIVCMIAYDTRYIIMDMYKGSATKIKTIAELAVVGRDCMRAIAYMHLHDKCVIHGDIKPDNILVNTDSSGTITKAALGDLGLSRACAKFLQNKRFVGTPGYMPMPNPVIRSTHDIYALAVSLLDAFLGTYPGQIHAKNDAHNLDDNTGTALGKLPDPAYKLVVSDMLASYVQASRKSKPTPKQRGEHIRAITVQWETIVSGSSVQASKITSYGSTDAEDAANPSAFF